MVNDRLRAGLSPERFAREGIQQAAEALTERREVKVKLPASHVLRLYYLKLTANMTYSDVVEDALARYFKELDTPEPPSL